MKKGVPEIAPSIRATCADCVRSSSAILATGVSGRALRTDAAHSREGSPSRSAVYSVSRSATCSGSRYTTRHSSRDRENMRLMRPARSRILARWRRRRIGRLVAHPGCDRAGLVSWPASGDLPGACCSSAASILANRCVISSNCRVSSSFGLRGEASPAALDQRGGDRSGDHREEADPGKHHDGGDEPANGLLSA